MNNRLSRSIRLAIAALVVAVAIPASSHRLDLPVTNVAGKNYYYYDVKQGDNLYDVSRRLNVSVDDIMKYNPSSRDGISPDMRLYFPTDDYVQVEDRSHTVAKNESLYGIAHAYGVSTDALLEANPAARDGIRDGMVLVIPGNDRPAQAPYSADAAAEIAETPAAQPVVVTEPETEPETEASVEPAAEPELPIYSKVVIGEGETLYRIAKERNMTLEELLALNPDIDILTYAAGDTLRVPAPQATGNLMTERVLNDTSGRDSHSITLLLPFMLDQENPERSAQHVTDFYRGFLLAADSLSHSGSPMRITVYDTAGSVERARELADRPEVYGADMVVMPADDAQMQAIVDVCGENTLLYNALSVQNTLQNTSPAVIQANIPHAVMYDKAVTAFLSMFDGYTPVFIKRNEGAAEKEAFVNTLRDRLMAAGVTCLDVNYDNMLKAEDLMALDDTGRYVIIPSSGRREEFVKFAGVLKTYRNKLDDKSRLRLFGYPDWVILRGSNMELLCDLDAVIYSRFYADPADPATIDVKQRYMRAYGSEWIDSAPNQALAGFDTGMYLIGLLRSNDGSLTDSSLAYRGVQQDVKLSDEGTEGMYNEALYLINFTPSGAVVKTRL